MGDKVGDKIVLVIRDSEDMELKDVDLSVEILDGNVISYDSVQEMLEDTSEDNSGRVVLILQVTDIGTVKNNPKFISISHKPEPKEKPKKVNSK